jgi:MinD-like ATPase involved in chromosome partitioning or flagellar assembly
MSRIISVHSFRGGTGKSNAAASVATLLAAEGQRVGVVDTDIQSPGSTRCSASTRKRSATRSTNIYGEPVTSRRPLTT